MYASERGKITFTLAGPDGLRIENLSPGVPVEINVDNAVAPPPPQSWPVPASRRCAEGSRSSAEPGAGSRYGLTERRKGSAILIDDYAHSPNEVRASIRSVKKLYPGKRLTVIFQPHPLHKNPGFRS